jgi:3' terminal RNA ribose 2'-O-methyltransferase Hen1
VDFDAVAAACGMDVRGFSRLIRMLLTLSTTHQPATDLGYLLHKNPSRVQSEELSFGKTHVFYPEATEELCTAALLLEVDPIALVRGRRGPAGNEHQFEQYVNDRPYAANSFLSVAIGRIFASALGGRSKDRQELANMAIPLVAKIPAIAGDEDLVRRLFEPLGYSVALTTAALDEHSPDWGVSPYVSLTLSANVRLQDLLAHLYVLVPVLDNEKHYWVGDDEIEKLLKRGEGWLPTHPERDLIVSRYLKRQRSLTREALVRLIPEEAVEEAASSSEEMPKAARTASLHEQRIDAVVDALRSLGAKRILDLGCGEGKLLRQLIADAQFETILGMDVSWRTLEQAKERLNLDRLSEKRQASITLMQGSLMYRDERLNGFDAAAVVEVIEHLDAPRLASFERVLFEFARPTHAIVTTPNAEYNALFETLPAGELRHRDHRFEWTRAEFEWWAGAVAARFGYTVSYRPLGPEDLVLGAPTQMAIFSLALASGTANNA